MSFHIWCQIAVDARHLHVLHVAEELALRSRQVHLHLFVVQVDLVLQMIRRAPVALRLEEAIAKHLRKHIVVVGLGARLRIGQLRTSRLQERRHDTAARHTP